ncbi:MAG: 2-hydroxy-3-oxopropionate reductase [bacterium]|jgi:2-hydroxy-3-oxopropionate reductase|nr:2-hydroxy-3-oxopropionate reductase [Solirubrobacteraceae bacterium]
MSERVAFIGLGVMGRPMARNLLQAGYEVLAHTRDSAVLAEFVDAGGQAGSSPAHVAAEADVVITMLPDSSVVSEVVSGRDGVFDGIRPGSLLIDMSTIDPATSRELAAAGADLGVQVLDAPVSGGDVGAKQGTLSIMVGGEAADFERARPVFDALGSTIVHVGPHGAGQVVKACNQILVGITYAGVSEALVLGAKSGVDPALILDVLSGGLAANRIMEVRRDNFLTHTFTPGFKIDLHHKDLQIALGAGAETDVALPLTAMVQQMFRMLRARGDGALDHSALLTVVEDWAGTGSVASERPAEVPA